MHTILQYNNAIKHCTKSAKILAKTPPQQCGSGINAEANEIRERISRSYKTYLNGIIQNLKNVG